MNQSDKELEWLKKNAKKNGINLKTDAEYRKLKDDMYGLAKLSLEMFKRQQALDHRLELEPDGFWMENEGGDCRICRGWTSQVWYDKYGKRCSNCQNTYLKKLIPKYVLSEEGKARFVTDFDLTYHLKIKRQIILRLVKKGELKARIIDRKPYQDTYIFLHSQNKNMREILLPYSEVMQQSQ